MNVIKGPLDWAKVAEVFANGAYEYVTLFDKPEKEIETRMEAEICEIPEEDRAKFVVFVHLDWDDSSFMMLEKIAKVEDLEDHNVTDYAGEIIRDCVDLEDCYIDAGRPLKRRDGTVTDISVIEAVRTFLRTYKFDDIMTIHVNFISFNEIEYQIDHSDTSNKRECDRKYGDDSFVRLSKRQRTE